jgi:hypothetical protein
MDAYTELLVKAMTYGYPETIPIMVHLLPAAWRRHPEEIKGLVARYPHFFGGIGYQFDYNAHTPPTYHEGKHTDEWGCVWSNIHEGMAAIVTEHPVKTREDIRALAIPADRSGNLPHGFMYLRILDLRGFEEAMVDFAEEPEELQLLIDKVLEYNMLQLGVALGRDGPIQIFGDDLGMQTGLAIGRDKWVKYMKPCFSKLYSKVHEAGKLVYMHTDGCIFEIMGDLRDSGVDMVNPQYRANGLDNLVRECKGKIPINLDLDRQYMPFATPQGMDDHIRECVEAMYLPQGGLGLSLEIGDDVPLEIFEAALVALDKYRRYKGNI